MAHEGALPLSAQSSRRRAVLGVATIALGLMASGAGLWLIAAPGGPPEIQNVASDLNRMGATGEMNGGLKGLVNLSLLTLPLILPLVWLVWLYNGIVGKEEQVFAAWAQVESNYQRRRDLVPNLVGTVERYLEYERGTLGEITEERGAALRALGGALDEVAAAQKDAEQQAAVDRETTQAELERLAAAQTIVDRSLGRFFALAENFPDLRAGDQFLELQAQLEGTENRINVARVRFNQRVEEFNGAIRQLPGSLLARVGDFRRKAYFQASEGAAEAAAVRFD